MGVVKETTADKWTVTGSSDGTEDVYIKVDGTIWSPGTTSDTDQFILRHDVSGTFGDPITNVDNGVLLKQGLAVNGTQAFDLQFQAPTATSTGGEHTLTVTLTAANWVDPCDAYPCAENDGAGTCTVAVAEGENGLPRCQRCNGVSTSVVNFAVGQQDTEGTYTCTGCGWCRPGGVCGYCRWGGGVGRNRGILIGTSVTCTYSTIGTQIWAYSTAAGKCGSYGEGYNYNKDYNLVYTFICGCD